MPSHTARSDASSPDHPATAAARRLGLVLADVAGDALGGGFFVLGKLRRRGHKSIHPHGEVRAGTLVRQGSAVATGVAWIDEPGRDRVLVRVSRTVGLPALLPDVLGLAVRVTGQGSDAGDLLLATAGTGPVGRFVPRSVWRVASSYTSLIPYRSPAGPLLLAASPLADDGSRFALACAQGTGPWSRFGVLELDPDGGDAPDPDVTFDPVRHEVPGLHSFRWAALLRRPAYAASRRSRGARLSAAREGATTAPGRRLS